MFLRRFGCDSVVSFSLMEVDGMSEELPLFLLFPLSDVAIVWFGWRVQRLSETFSRFIQPLTCVFLVSCTTLPAIAYKILPISFNLFATQTWIRHSPS